MTGPTELIRSYLAAFATGDPDRVAEHVTAGFVNEHVAALGDGCSGRDEYRRRLPGFLGSFTGLRYEDVDVIGDGVGAPMAATYRMRAVYEGHPIDLRGVMVFEVVGDLISRRSDYWDSLTFLRQTGQHTPT